MNGPTIWHRCVSLAEPSGSSTLCKTSHSANINSTPIAVSACAVATTVTNGSSFEQAPPMGDDAGWELLLVGETERFKDLAIELEGTLSEGSLPTLKELYLFIVDCTR